MWFSQQNLSPFFRIGAVTDVRQAEVVSSFSDIDFESLVTSSAKISPASLKNEEDGLSGLALS